VRRVDCAANEITAQEIDTRERSMLIPSDAARQVAALLLIVLGQRLLVERGGPGAPVG
jgi:hypothetical protein